MAQDLASAWGRHLDQVVEAAAAAALLSDDDDPVEAAPEKLQRAMSDPKHRSLRYYSYMARRALHTRWLALRSSPGTSGRSLFPENLLQFYRPLSRSFVLVPLERPPTGCAEIVMVHPRL